MQWLALSNLFYLLIIPIILIFYLLKRKYEDKEISSILLWNKMIRDLEANKPWQKLRRNLLLILQLLVATLLIIALLRPALPTNGVIASNTVIVVDTSLSMQTREGNQTRFDIARKEIKNAINNLGDHQTITLIDMGVIPKIILSKSSDKSALLSALDSIKVRNGYADDLAALSLAKSIAAKDSDSGIMLFGDGANYKILNKKETLPENISFKHINVGKTRENLSLSTFATYELKNKIIGLLRIDNNGFIERDGLLKIYDFQNTLIYTDKFMVDGNESYTVELDELPVSNAYRAVIEVDNDSLVIDNQIWSVPFKKENTNALFVSQGNHFLSQALTATNLIHLDKVNDLPNTIDKEVDLYIYDEMVPSELPEGNVLLINPNKSTGWLQFKGEIEAKHVPEVVLKDHPLLKYVDFEKVHLSKYKALGKISGLDSIVQVDHEPIILAGTIEGKRIVILSFDIYKSDFPLRTAFPMFVQNTVEWLSPHKSLPIGNGYPEERITIPFSTGVTKKMVIVPSGKEFELDTSHMMNTFNLPDEVGLYSIEEVHNNKKEIRYFPVQIREEESFVKPEQVQIYSIATPKPDEEVKDKKDYTGFKDLFPYLAFLALIVSFIEWVVYKRGY